MTHPILTYTTEETCVCLAFDKVSHLWKLSEKQVDEVTISHTPVQLHQHFFYLLLHEDTLIFN